MKNSEKMISAILTIILGILFIVLKEQVIGIGMTILGVLLIVAGVLDLIGSKQTYSAVVKIVIGVLFIVFGWTIVSAVLYILAALLLVYGIYLFYDRIKTHMKGANLLSTIITYVEPALFILIAFFLFFNQGGTIEWVFIVSGIFAIIEGALMFLDALKKE